MVDLPIFCSSCGAIFPSGIVAENLTNAAHDDINGSCPYCGGSGQVPAGLYNFIGRTIELLNAPEKTVDELNKLSVILRNFDGKKTGVHEIRQQILQEVPKYALIVDLLPVHQNELLYIQMILFIITIVITLMLTDQQAPISTETIIAELYKHLTPSQTHTIGTHKDKNIKSFGTPDVGRNDLCTCGSGKKYKKCCGKVI
jgi:hypothetical protein